MAFTAADMLVHVGADVKDAVAGMNQVGGAVDKAGAGTMKASLLMGAGAGAIVGGFGLAINSAMNFDGAMADVSASLGVTGDDLSKLSDLALKIGQDTAFSATQGAQAIEELGKAGVSVTDIMSGAGMAAAQLASATGSDIPTAANVMSNAMNAFSLDGSQATRVADVMTAALNESSLSMGDFANGMASTGTIAASLGIPIEDTAASLAIFSNYGMSGADAGTSLRTMLTRLAGPTDEAKTLMDQLGISAFDASGKFVGMANFAGNLKTSLADMSDEQRMATLQTIFGQDAQRVANILYQEGAEGVNGMSDALQSNGQAQEAANRRLSGLRGSLEQLQGSVETLFITFGELLTPALSRAALFVNRLVGRLISLPKPAKQIIAGIAGVTAGILALGAGIGLLLTMSGPLIAGFAAMGAALSAILLPVALIVAAGVGLYYAWTHNFLGIQDIVSSVVGTVVGWFKQLVMFLDIVTKTTGNTSLAIGLLPSFLQPLGNSIARVVDAFQIMYNALSRDGLGGLLDVLPAQLSRIGDALKTMGSIILGAFMGLPWAEIGSTIWNGLLTALGFIGNFALELVGKLGDLTAELATWLWDEASAVDWAGILSRAAGMAGDVASTIVGKLGDLTNAISIWLGLNARSVDWSGILSRAASMAGNIVGTIVSKLGDLGTGLKTWYDNAINSVDWGNIGFLVGQKVGSLVRTLAPKAAEIVRGLADAVRNANWGQVALAIGAMIIALPATIAYLGYTLAPKALEFLKGFSDGLGIHWNVVGNWLAGLPGKLLAATPGLLGTLLDKGVEVIQGLYNGLVNKWPTVVTYLSQVGQRIFTIVGSLLATLPARGVEAFQGLQNGLDQRWPGVVGFLKLVGSLIYAAVGSLLGTLVSRGVEAMRGLWDGMSQKFGDIRSWLGGLPNYILGAIPAMGGLLWQSGWDLMMGFWGGISAGWDWVKGQLSRLNPLDYLPHGSGPFMNIAPDLYNSGLAIMQSFGRGMQDGLRQLESPTGIAPALTSAVTTAGQSLGPAGPAQVIYYDNRTFTVNVDDLPDVAKAAELVRDIQRDHELVYGAS